MTKTYYHATPFENLESILKDQEVHKGCDGVVYLAKKPEDAVKFLAIRGCKKKFLFLVLCLMKKRYRKVLTIVKHSLSVKPICILTIFRLFIL